MCLCVFLKGGEKAVSDTKCHIGRDINCRSDASSRAAQICLERQLFCYTCAWYLSVCINPFFGKIIVTLLTCIYVTGPEPLRFGLYGYGSCFVILFIISFKSDAPRCFFPVCIQLIFLPWNHFHIGHTWVQRSSDLCCKAVKVLSSCFHETNMSPICRTAH